MGSLVLFSFLLLPLAVGAANSGFGASGSDTNFGASDADTTSGRSVTLLNPLGVDSFSGLVDKILNAAILIGIPIAVLFIVLAGFKFVFAQGNPEALKKARRNFLNTIIGIAIFVGASLIATVIIKTLTELGVKGL